MAPKGSSKKSTVPFALDGWVPKLFLGAGVAVLLSLLFQGGGRSKHVTYLSVSRMDQLKEVMFGDDAWTVLCTNETTIDRPIPKYFEASAKRLDGQTKFGVLDCGAKLPSGKTTYQKLKLRRDVDPVLFLAVGEEKPRQIPAKRANTMIKLMKYLRESLEPKLFEIGGSKSLQKYCSGAAKACLLLFRGKTQGAGMIADELTNTHDEIVVGLLDKRKRLALAGMEEVNAMMFTNHTVSGDDSVSRGVMLFTDEVTMDNLDDFVYGAKAGSHTVIPLRKAPRVVNIVSKKEQARLKAEKEREKRKAAAEAAVGEDGMTAAEREARIREEMDKMSEDLVTEEEDFEEDIEEEEADDVLDLD